MPDSLQKYTSNQWATINLLGKRGIKIWPHPLSDAFVQRKYHLFTVIAGFVDGAGGLGERPVQITSLKQGTKLLETGFVIKKDLSRESTHIYKTGSQDQFKSEFSQAATTPSILFAMKFNPAILDRGEVRVYMAYGIVSYMVHTIPQPQNAAEARMGLAEWTSMRAELCHGLLQPTGSIELEYFLVHLVTY